ncbi:MAG: tetratricopeptide repeat protein [Candidatus Helarchaeota archaeon]
MKRKVFTLKGILKKDMFDITESDNDLDESIKAKISNILLKKIPKFVFEKSKSPRTLIFEDALGYDIIKFFYINDNISFFLIRSEGKFYTNDEIKKISLKVNQTLNPNLSFSELNKKVQEILIGIESYDFSRPIKAQLFNIFLTDKDKSLKIDEILSLLNKYRHSENVSEVMEFYKYQFLIHFQKKKHNEPDSGLSNSYNKLISYIKNFQGAKLNQYDIATIFFNFGLILKELGFLKESIDMFSKSAFKFEELHLDNLQIFSIFNKVLILKQQQKFDLALEQMLEIENIVHKSKLLANGFRGIFFRHLGELFQIKKNYKFASSYYRESLNYFEKDKQINVDTALNYLALGTINYNKGDYFGASKYFSFAANIFSFLNQDITEITKNLGLAFLNHANEYLKAIKILIIEKETDMLIDLFLKGLNYLFLSNFHLGNQILDKFIDLYGLYSDTLDKIMNTRIKKEDKNIGKQIKLILKEHCYSLRSNPNMVEIKKLSKNNYEKLKVFQPLKAYYFMIIYKTKGVAIYSKTSTILDDLPLFDMDLIAGLITAMDSFLEEVLTGEENLFLIDRDNIKIIFEYTENLVGLMFLNKENPQIRIQMRNILEKLEGKYKVELSNWTGEITKFKDIEEMASKIIR